MLNVPDMSLLNSMKFYYEYKRNEIPDYFASFNLRTQVSSRLQHPPEGRYQNK